MPTKDELQQQIEHLTELLQETLEILNSESGGRRGNLVKKIRNATWVYEDELPPMSREEFSSAFDESKIVDGVRMYPPKFGKTKDAQ